MTPIVRRRAVIALIAFVCGISGLGSIALATTMRALSIDDLARDADLVIVGHVVRVSEVVVPSEGRLAPLRVALVAIDERVAGDEPSPSIRVVDTQGRLGALHFVRDGSMELRRGQRVMLFVDRTRSGYRAVGMAQGAFVVSSDRRFDAVTVARAGDPGILFGSAKARGVDLGARPDLDAMRDAVRAVRGVQ